MVRFFCTDTEEKTHAEIDGNMSVYVWDRWSELISWVHIKCVRYLHFRICNSCVWFARSASPPKWHVHVNIAVVYSNWRWNNKYFLISNRIVIRLYFCECERAQRNKHTKKNSRFHFSFLFFVVSFFMLLISSRSRLFMVRSWEKTEFHTHSPTCYLKPSGIILHPK